MNYINELNNIYKMSMQTINMRLYPSRVLIYGGTGQAKIVKSILEKYNSDVEAIIDETPNLKSPFLGVPIYQSYEDFKKKHDVKELGFVVAIGNSKRIKNAVMRKKLSEMLKKEGMIPMKIVHPDSYIDILVKIGEGTQISAGSKIMTLAEIGNYCIINTGASVDHDSILEDCVEIAPMATVCGEVTIGENTWIGANATILPGLKIGKNCVIGAGSVVTKNIPDDSMFFGNPAKFIKKTEY